MNNQQIKTKLIEVFGEKPVAFIQAIRFIYLLLVKHKRDPEVDLLPILVQKGDTTIDVGANGADWTYWLHHNVGKSGIVYSFEADPYYALATDIAIKLMRLKGVQLFPFGLSELNEEVPLVISDPKGSRLSGLSHVNRHADKHNDNVKIVKLKRLDSLTKDYPQLDSVKLIKCDVEGYELFVFRGAVEILESSRPYVILEIGNFTMQGYTAEDLFEFFAARNYSSFAMIGDRTLARTNQMMEHKQALSVNRLMLPIEKLVELKGEIRIVE